MLRIDDIPQQVADDIHASRRDLLRPLALPAILWYNEAKKGGIVSINTAKETH